MTAVCLLGGVVFGIATGLFVAPPPRATPTARPVKITPTAAAAGEPAAEVSVTPGDQKSLLLFGVTDANSPAVSLEACWVISFRPGVAQYYVLAFPPSAVLRAESMGGSFTLTEIYAEDMRQQLGHTFVRDAVTYRFPAFATIQADVVLDRGDLSALVGQLGGLTLNSQVLTGPALLQTYDTWPAASDLDRLNFQGDVVQQLFGLLAERQWSAADLVAFVTQIPRVSADTNTVVRLNAFAQGAPPVASENLIWRAYGPEMEASLVP